MKVGLIARADRTGLAVQTWAFWRNMNPDRTLVVDLSYCSGKHPDMALYPGAELWRTKTYPDTYSEPDEQLDAFLDDVDVVFTCETPYNYWLFERAREKGVRTVLQFNYEFLEYLVAPKLPRPDLFAAPSLWNWNKLVRTTGEDSTIHLPVPVDREILERSGALRERNQLRQVLHTVGNPAVADRNGTNILLEAIKHVKSPVQFRILAQRRFQKPDTYVRDSRVKFDYQGTRDFWDQYKSEDDMYVMPRRFGGLCLPINESLALGMPVMMTKCPPNNLWLPDQMLVPGRPSLRIKTRAPLTTVDANPYRLAARIDEFHEHPQLMMEGSRWALGWAEKNSWDALRGEYEAALQGP